MNFGWYRMLLFNESFIKLCVKALYFFFFSVITFKLPIEIKCIFWQIQCPWIFWRKQVNRNHSCYHTIIFNTRAFQCASILWLTLRKSLSKTVDNRQVGKVFSWIGSYALTNECREKPVQSDMDLGENINSMPYLRIVKNSEIKILINGG